MDLDYLKKQVQACHDEAEELGTDGPAYAELLAYIDEQRANRPFVVKAHHGVATPNVRVAFDRALESRSSTDPNLAEIRRLDLQLVRFRAALREALEMVRVGYTDERLNVLQDFLDGKREGL